MSAASIALRSALQNTERTAASQGRRVANCILRMPTGDSRQSDTSTAGSIETSGCVMKCTTVMLVRLMDVYVPQHGDAARQRSASCGQCFLSQAQSSLSTADNDPANVPVRAGPQYGRAASGTDARPMRVRCIVEPICMLLVNLSCLPGPTLHAAHPSRIARQNRDPCYHYGIAPIICEADA
jgi:hypothetical protein